MNKNEFLNTLRKRLNVLEDKEIEDIISEYEGYIEEKVNIGLTEVEAVKELGNIDEIVKDLLAAYKVKEPKREGFKDAIDKFCSAVDNFMNSLDDKSARDIIRIIVEVIIILLAIWILKIPFAIIRDLGERIFHELYSPVGNLLSSIWWIVIETSYVIVAIVLFFKMFEKRYFKGVSSKIIEEVEDEYKKDKQDSNEKRKENAKNKQETSEVKSKQVVTRRHSFADTLTDICIICLKFMAIFFVIGLIFYLIGMSVAVGFMIYLIIKGVTYFGVLILLIALFMGGAFILDLLISFIFNKRIKATRVFIKLITCIIALALGVTITAIEVTTTEIIYDNFAKTKTITKTVAMEDNLKFYNYDNLIVDETLGDDIRIEYVYPDLDDNLELKIELDYCGNHGYCLETNLKHFRLSNGLIDILVNNLKHRKIYAYDFKLEKNVYANKENIAKLKKANYDSREQTIVKKLEVISLYNSSDEEYVNLAVKSNYGDIENLRVSRFIASDVQVNNAYEFVFLCDDMYLDDLDGLAHECRVASISSSK